MEAAIVASDRGHEVILCEKSEVLGGALKFAEYDQVKSDLHCFKETLIRRLGSRAIKVMLNMKITSEYIQVIAPDAIINAAGAEPIIPAIPGIDSPNVVLAADSYGKSKEIGKRVVIIGGGLVGCETAIYHARNDHEVVILEKTPGFCHNASFLHKRAVELEMKKYKIELKPSMKCLRICENELNAIDNFGKEYIFKYENIIVACGMMPLSKDFECFRNQAMEYIIIGDCLKTGTVQEAIRTGFDAAFSI